MADSVLRNMSRILLTVPAWNEEEIVETSLRSLHAACGRLLAGHDWHIELMDNGSTDATPTIVEQLGRELGRLALRRTDERGKGLAIRLSWLAGAGAYDVYAFSDADLSTDVGYLPDLIAPVLDGSADVVCGSRLAPGAVVHRSPFRRTLTHCYSIVQRAYLGLPVRDAQCGFKAVSPRVVRDVLPLSRERRYLFDTELLALAKARGYAIREIPVEWGESARRSRVRPFRDSLAFLSGMFAIKRRI